MQEQHKALTNLYQNARALVGQQINVKQEGKEKVKLMRVIDVKFNRKHKCLFYADTNKHAVALTFRAVFETNIYSDITFKTEIPQ